MEGLLLTGQRRLDEVVYLRGFARASSDRMNPVPTVSPSATISPPPPWKGLTSQEARERLEQSGDFSLMLSAEIPGYSRITTAGIAPNAICANRLIVPGIDRNENTYWRKFCPLSQNASTASAI